VAPLVVAEGVLVVERLPADAAVELLVLAVASLVQPEGARGAEALQADFAAERLQRRLVPLPGLEEALRAVGAPVRVHVLLVDQQSAVEEEGLPAQVAHERLPGAVDEHVALQLGVVRETLAALRAGERLLPRVDAEVPLEVVVQAEPGAADVAGERLLPRVHRAVPLQGRAGAVRPLAHGARERRDARVLPLVHGQRVGVLEGLLAHAALILLGAGVDDLVEAERVLALELLAAGGAAERPLLRVHGHVAPQLHRRPAALVTEVTLELLLPLLVAQQVVFQRPLDPEGLPALVAGERLRRLGPPVAHEVILKRLLLPERPLAKGAGEGQRGFARLVAREVIFQRPLFQETPATLIARERLLVDLHVFLQVALPVERDAAMLAGEPLRRLRVFSANPPPLHSGHLDLFLFRDVVS